MSGKNKKDLKIEHLRKQIDNIDINILKLLHKRTDIVTKVKQYKDKNNLKIYSPARETYIINNIIKNNRKIFPEKTLIKIYNEIFSASRKLQKKINIGFLGPSGTFSNIAAEHIFGSQSEYIPLNSFRAIFTELDSDQIDYGVVPIENSIEGIVGNTLDLLTEFNHYIIEEFYLQITNNIISKEKALTKVKTLYTHPQPLGQCRTFIENNLDKVNIIETFSTAEAARLASLKKNSAAISSTKAAEKYKLSILAERINDNLHNYTRFIVLSKRPIESFNENLNFKSSLLIGMKDKPGVLFSILKPFKNHGINMTKIESRPTRKKAWEYVFFIEFTGNPDSLKVKKTMSEVEHLSTYFKQLGYYPVCKNVL